MSRHTDSSDDHTGRDLLEWLSGGGGQVLSRQTLHQYSSCARHVLAVLPHGLATDLQTLDLDEASRAFRQANEGPEGRAAQTVNTYLSSFKAAVRAFLKA